jgi:hypothetical protein
MFTTNNKQTQTINELFRMLMTPDLSDDYWILKQIYFTPSVINPEEFEKITLVFFDNKTKTMLFLKSIDANGNIVGN